jgi:hypothetical protein
MSFAEVLYWNTSSKSSVIAKKRADADGWLRARRRGSCAYLEWSQGVCARLVDGRYGRSTHHGAPHLLVCGETPTFCDIKGGGFG